MKKRLLLPLLLLLTGCNVLEWPAYVLFGQESRTVPAAYKGLESRRTAILVIGQPGIDFEYPFARLDLALAIQDQIAKNVPGVVFVDPQRTEEVMRTEVDFLALSIPEIAQRLDAQRLAYVELLQFTMREPESINLLRGHVWAQVSVFETDALEPEKPAFETEIEVIYPVNAPVPASDESRYSVWQNTIARAADQLARQFYKHKESTRTQ